MHKIAMSGASGFVGSALTRAFNNKGWSVIALERDDFDTTAEALARKLDGADVIVNLAGAPILGRWTAQYKSIMYSSRVGLTDKLIASIALMDTKPELFVSTSAVGFYDQEGEHDEYRFKHADDFLGGLTEKWEQAANRAKEQGIRTVIFRFGIVMGKGGGALSQMIKPFSLGLGGTIGDGSQPFSWVHIEDLTRAYIAAIEDKSYEGTFNLTAPHPTTNKGLTNALAAALHKPAIMRVPEFVLRLQYGEGATALTGGQTVYPKRLTEKGFHFTFSDIGEAVKDSVREEHEK